MTFSDIDPPFIENMRNQAELGREVYFFESTDSTNLCAERAFVDGAKHGSVFIANTQSVGRGRFGRSWLSTPGAGIYLSILLRPDLAKEDCPKISLLPALAAVLAINEVCGVQAKLKWPNDVLLNGKKICGVLSEFYCPDPDSYGIIVGIGINVHHNQGHFERAGLADVATSLDIETGVPQNRNILISAFLEEMENLLTLLLAEKFEQVLEQWKSHCEMFGKDIILSQGTSTYSGKALGLDDQGNLLLETGENKTLSFSSGETSLKK
ncbi:MAG: biotin--[acetyl-CoA-carboxylase] ligase [Nitrospinae bacterium CG11_big_fil_rev_8_21_14_0_20_45_15]|nr:MAG: biotin--[acetyl-CoA-carboxylase] ligase [Nitrospinae bacterium CG11_big_fil_rev_8_21_14_0_20_45_15]